jgi:hypothetical protein
MIVSPRSQADSPFASPRIHDLAVCYSPITVVVSGLATVGAGDAAGYPELRLKNAKVFWLNSLTFS